MQRIGFDALFSCAAFCAAWRSAEVRTNQYGIEKIGLPEICAVEFALRRAGLLAIA
ncbi:hypothetical protein PQR62_01625 [Herbaspirillum lusitanum]|uniref:Uncharacterized protein n=1 Tax=Herbaspirillum lusitanum TaxID=213312 RepID=A0ABW9A4L6_9BURK